MQYVINGRQLSGNLGGVQRYLREILLELDQISSPNEITVVVSKKATNIPSYKNIQIERFGFLKGLIWEQISLPIYLLTHHKQCVNLCTIVPFLYPRGIVTIHDVMLKSNPEMQKHFKFIQLCFLKLNYVFSTLFCKKIITVSEESKKDICKYYHVDSKRISIISNEWQHINRISQDDSIYLKYQNLHKNEFFLALSANRWQKNFNWIVEVAKRNPDKQFVIAGGIDKSQKTKKIEQSNILYLGYVSDELMKSLYKNCKAFLFPSICEGFGIPPLEALACGAKIIISNTSCLPEIFENSSYYINPYVYDYDLNVLLSTEVKSSEKVLNKYSWFESAKKLYQLMKD